jgi:LPLT family lysophospholipid transporter-like MFS transporter
MKRGFYTIIAAQFFSSLADNALLVAAIALLFELDGPEWMTPLLKFFFVVSYVLLAAAVGAFADAFPKGKVMFITNTIKIAGCVVMFFYDYVTPPGVPEYVVVLIAYGIVGLGAAAYSPAKYGILTELLPAEQLVVANGWIEGLTVLSVILGTVLGGALISPAVAMRLLSVDLPHIDLGIETPAEAAIALTALIYVVAAIVNLYIPETGARYRKQSANPVKLVVDFARCCRILWKDRLGQISLATTTLFWGAGATLQFILLKWAEQDLGMPLDKGAALLGVTAVGIALGATLAARLVPLRKSISVLPVGVVMGLSVILLTGVTAMPLVYALLILIGAMAGFFVVPMNAVLQHRGYVLLSAGHSIAVQNFSENLAILIMLSLYAGLIWIDLRLHTIIIVFGAFVAGTTLLVIRRHQQNQRDDQLRLVDAARAASQVRKASIAPSD